MQNVELHGLDILPDEILIVILSCLTSFKEAVRTSVLSRSISYNRLYDWIQFAMQKEVRVFELNVPYHKFPNLDKFLSISRAVMKPPEDHFGGGLSHLTSLTLVKVNIDNEMIEYLLSNCPHLEHLCIMFDTDMVELNVVSPSLKSLIVCFCANLRTLTISAENLVSFEYGDVSDRLVLELKYEFQNVPLLSELKLKGGPCGSLLLAPSWHSCYSRQLERPLLDVPCDVRNNDLCLFHVYLACPLLSRFVVQFLYDVYPPKQEMATRLLDDYKRVEADFSDYHHQCLELVKLIDFACYPSDFKFASALLQIAKSLDTIIISPGNGYHGHDRISTVREQAKKLEPYLPHGAKLVILQL
ncbi:hypothetical protein ACH5RR_008071 [Cinchona calisaya]|uniref:At1g61320/AtMIF1 LRR domain-containing protein n=1 Tax=Cinchona calisaya TaxID=153742 RepID=A0ABD3AAJ7_9GENT